MINKTRNTTFFFLSFGHIQDLVSSNYANYNPGQHNENASPTTGPPGNYMDAFFYDSSPMHFLNLFLKHFHFGIGV